MKKIYFIGIKGVGMTPLAIIAKEAGCAVGGSDTGEKFITDKSLSNNGITSDIGFSEENIKKFFADSRDDGFVIYSASHSGGENFQVKWAEENGIKTLTQGEAIGMIMDGSLFGEKRIGISVAGTHGKTTTSALTAFLLTRLGKDPGYFIGSSEIYPLGEPGHFGQGKFFVAEADEYIGDKITSPDPKFLAHTPKYVLVTNVDFDHPDVFKDIQEIKIAFIKLLKKIPDGGFAVLNLDDKNSVEVAFDAGCRYITFGMTDEADYTYSNIKETSIGQTFDIEVKGQIHSCKISLSGNHNVSNAVSALAMLDGLNFPIERVSKFLPEFIGTKRRNETIGKTKEGAIIIDDYAHHPREITTTLTGLKNKYNKKIVVVFQPHTYSRTDVLLSDFVDSFKNADEVIILPVFASAREALDTTNVEERMKYEITKKVKNITFLPSLESVVEYLSEKKFGNNYIIVTMGAGDVYKIAEKIKK